MPISILELFYQCCFYIGTNSRGVDGAREEIWVLLLDGACEAKEPSRNFPEM